MNKDEKVTRIILDNVWQKHSRPVLGYKIDKVENNNRMMKEDFENAVIDFFNQMDEYLNNF